MLQFEWNFKVYQQFLQVSFHLSKKGLNDTYSLKRTLPWRSVWQVSLTQLWHQWSEQLLLLVQSKPQRVRHVSRGGFHVLCCFDGFVQWAVQEILPISRRWTLSRLFLTSDSCCCVVVVARKLIGWWWAQPEVGLNTKKCDISSTWDRKNYLDGLTVGYLQDRKWTQVLERWRWSCGCTAFHCFSWLLARVCVNVCESVTVCEWQKGSGATLTSQIISLICELCCWTRFSHGSVWMCKA